MKFREDINGLRAIAVIAVVLFHFNPSWMPGGFAGVDVFFVISGFLMTGIIFRGIEQGNFSIIKFYLARANRIIPALAVLCLVLLVFGWFYLIPSDYALLGKHAATSVGFISNIIYWRESGYFDASSHEKWLLHTWSLSVEWQFYIVYPIVLVTLKKIISTNTIKKCLFLGTLAGFIFCIIATIKWPTPAYFSLPTRAWEMMLGGLAFLYPLNLKDSYKKLIEWIGIILIFGSYIFIDKSTPWPGYLAIFPVLGSFMIIQAQSNSIITCNSIFQKLGAWSYSIYLWHWPIVVAIYYFSLNESYIFAGIALSIFLGFLSYTYIEKLKFKNDFKDVLSYFNYKPIYFLLAAGISGLLVFSTNGIPAHYNTKVIKANDGINDRNSYNCMTNMVSNAPFSPCIIGDKKNIKAIIVGDSHADAMTSALVQSVLPNGGVLALTKASCPFIMNIKHQRYGDECFNENIERMEFLTNNYKDIPIFWVARTSAYIYGQSNPKRIRGNISGPVIYFSAPYLEPNEYFFDELKKNLELTISSIGASHPVFIIQPTPEMRKNVPKTLAKQLQLGEEYDDLSISSDLYFKRNQRTRNIINDIIENNNIQALDPIPFLCIETKCIAQQEGVPIYYDGDHLSESGNKLLVPMLQAVLE